MPRPKGTTRAKKPILKKEYERLINATNRSTDIKSVTKAKLIGGFTLLYLTGCRVSEIVKLNSRDISQMIESNEFSLTNFTKTKSPRLISFDEQRLQVEFLKKLLPKEKDKFLFAKNNSNHPMSASSLTILMNKFIHSILGELYSTHSFRAGYITIAHQQGLSLEHIRQDIGHKSMSTTARYATVTSQEISRGKNARAW